MRILFLAPTPFFSLRGTPIAIHQVLRRLSACGHHVDLFTFPMGEDIELPGLRIIRCGKFLAFRRVGLGPSVKKAALDFFIFLHLVYQLLARRNRHDLIHAVDEMALGCWAVSWLIKCPVIYDMDSSVVEQFHARKSWSSLSWIARWAEARMLETATLVMPVCESLADRAKAIVSKKPCIVLPDLPVTSMEAGGESAAESPELAGLEGPLVVYAGNLAPYQGVRQLIEAVGILWHAGRRSTLVIVGGNAEDIARFDAPEGQVVFLGSLPPERLPEIYRRAHCLVSPRMTGTNTPMKIYDYMQSGKVIVATRLRTHTQVLDETSAILTAPCPQGLADGIELALADEARAARIAENARRLLHDNFSPVAFERRLFRAYALAAETFGRSR